MTSSFHDNRRPSDSGVHIKIDTDSTSEQGHMSSVITFYDISSILPAQSWSPSTWRIRYSLNYKGLSYRTVWVDLPDIEEVCQRIGATTPLRKTGGGPQYTLPIIDDPSTGAVVSDGPLIAEYLDVTYPSAPKLFPQGTLALQYAFLHAHRTTLSALSAFIVPAAVHILNKPTQKYYRCTREQWYGKKLEEITPTGQERIEEWKKVKEGFSVIDTWLTRGGGPYFMGDTLSFADITVVSFLQWTKRVLGESSEEWQDIKRWHGGRWDELVRAFEKYETLV